MDIKKILKFKENNKFSWAIIILDVVIGFITFISFPLWNNTNVFWAPFGEYIVRSVLSILLIYYMVRYVLIRLINNTNKSYKIIHLIEFILLFVLLLGLILPMFKIDFNVITSPCVLIGAILWLKGSTEVFDSYFYLHEEETHYPIYKVFLSIIFITLGVIMIIKNFINMIGIEWILFGLLLVLFVYLIFYIIIGWPKKEN